MYIYCIGNYFIFRFDEEVLLREFDVPALSSQEQINNSNYIEGTPIFKTGEDLLKHKLK